MGKRDFCFYFLKEGTRTYEQSDLMTLLLSNPNITGPDSNLSTTEENIFVYHHQTLNFEAQFIMANKSVIPNLERLEAKYFDVNFYVKFDILTSNYALEIILDVIEEIVKKFRFFIYNEALNNIQPFRRAVMIKVFTAWKNAFAAKFPDQVAEYNFLDPQAYSQVSSYLQKRKRLELTIDASKVVVSNYIFYKSNKSRSAYVAIKWDGEKSFILPPSVDVFYLDDGKLQRFISMKEILSKTEKLFRSLDGYGDIQILDAKNVKKFHKFLVKERFAPLGTKLELLSLEKILDV